MLRVRKITDTRAVANAAAVAEAQRIIQMQFPGIPQADIDKLPDQLDNPFNYEFVSELFIAEDARQRIQAIAILMHDPNLAFAFLELVAVAPGVRSGSGIGGAVYDRVRDEAIALGDQGLYFECLPDDPAISPDPAIRRQNAARLKFYERYGAYPILGTDYQAPISPGDSDMPYLVFDGLTGQPLPKAAQLRRIVRAILERKYSNLCTPEYIEQVVTSIRSGAFKLRAPQYIKDEARLSQAPGGHSAFPLIVNDKHDIHHIRERGYVESPVRVASILAELDKSGLFQRTPAKHFPDRYIREVHDGGLVNYIERACAEAPANKSVYPYVFPIRNPQRKPRERSVLAGYWCIDTFTPLNRNVWPAARGAVDCALTAADSVLNGAKAAYALIRPPGHHAERRSFGGFCYFSNAAIAANYLSRFGRVAILDIDYHHGNGQQDIFYERDDVLTVSIHGHPSFAYPYFSGFRNETGRGAGAGFNVNFPLPEVITPEQYRETLELAIRRVVSHDPAYLVICLGLDTARGDPTGTWPNRAANFRSIGIMIGQAGLPTTVIQEGGYRVRTLGVNARNFFAGLADGIGQARPGGAAPRRTGHVPSRVRSLSFRDAVRRDDAAEIKMLVAATGKFTTEEIDISEELVVERVTRGRLSGYEFIVAEENGAITGYACFGRVPGSEIAFDLYWIAVHPDCQGRGLGAQIMARAEASMQRMGAQLVYADTSSTDTYAPTRAFYERAGFSKAAELPDFYRPGDGKVIYQKRIAA